MKLLFSHLLCGPWEEPVDDRPPVSQTEFQEEKPRAKTEIYITAHWLTSQPQTGSSGLKLP